MANSNWTRALIMGVLVTVAAVSAAGAAEHGQWTHYGNNSDIRAIHRTGNQLWVGTNGGLLVVDLDTGDVTDTYIAGPMLAGNSVRAIREWDGRIYVGCDEGLSLFSPDREGGYTSTDIAGVRDVRSIVVGGDGRTYVATYGHGVARMEGRSTRWITRVDSLLDNKVFAVAPVGDEDVYFATSLGLCAYVDSAWVSFQAGAGLPRGEVRDLIDTGRQADRGDDEQWFYVLIAGRGVYRFTGTRGRRILSRHTFEESDVAAITVDAEGTLWACGRYGGIARYDRGEWKRVGDDDVDIANARWRCAHAAADGMVYFGSADGLLAGVGGDAIRKILLPSAIPAGNVGVAAEDPLGRLFFSAGPYLVSTEEDTTGFKREGAFGSVFAIEVSPAGAVYVVGRWGVFRKEDGRWVDIPIDIDPKRPVFVSLGFDSTAGDLWVGTRDGEIYRNEGRLWIRVANRFELTGGAIDRIVVDGRRRVWAASTASGVFRFGRPKWRDFETAVFDSCAVRQLLVDTAGVPVVLTKEKIWRYGSGQTWEPVSGPDPTQAGDYQTVGFGANDSMFLGTSQGLTVISGGETRSYGARDGLGGTDVTSVLVDSKSNLWVGFRRDGLTRISLVK